MGGSISYRGWTFFYTGVERVQGSNLFWDIIITNDQNSDSREVSTQRFTPPDDPQVFDQVLAALDIYIDNNGGTIG